MISAVIVTYNEANNEAKTLKNCLSSITGYVDEIVVVDLGSNDDSVKIAKQYQAKIFTHKKVDFVEKVRDFAVSKAQGDWILVLDPDEIITPTLWKKFKEIASEGKFEAVNIPRKNIFFGRFIKHTNWWPDNHVRFFKNGSVKWNDKIHVYPKVYGRVLDLPAIEDLAIIHRGYDSIQQFIDRQNRYSSVEADNLYNEGGRFSWTSFFWWPAREFLVRFIKHQGFLDGFYGFSLTYLMMVYKIMVLVKLWERGKERREE
ncbi:MAG: glycosyltransferase family 2 protein [Patescibacteria group bacterium]